MKFWILIAALFILTPALWVGAYLFHSKSTVGVVLVDECRQEYGKIITDGFNQYYGNYFKARLLPARFYASDVKTKNGAYLNSDFFRFGKSKELKIKYDVDIILYCTDHHIKDWDKWGMGLWGQADTDSGSALMTVKYWMKDPQKDIKLQRMALHEVFHLYGYIHNKWDWSGIMQYAQNIGKIKLCRYYEAQLPIRSMVYKIGFGRPFHFATFITDLAFSLTLIPAFIAIALVLFHIFSNLTKNKKPTYLLVILNVIQSLYLSIKLNGTWYLLAIPVALMVLFHTIQYGFQKSRGISSGFIIFR